MTNADEITLDLTEEVSFLNKAAIKKTLKNFKPQYDEEGNNYNTHVRVAHRSTI